MVASASAHTAGNKNGSKIPEGVKTAHCIQLERREAARKIEQQNLIFWRKVESRKKREARRRSRAPWKRMAKRLERELIDVVAGHRVLLKSVEMMKEENVSLSIAVDMEYLRRREATICEILGIEAETFDGLLRGAQRNDDQIVALKSRGAAG